MKEKQFASPSSFKIVFIFFCLGSLFGTFFEELLEFIIHHHFESRQGLIFGPFNPVYGIVCAAFIILLRKGYQERNIFKTWFYTSIISGFLEFIEHFIFAKVFGVEFWNYNNYFLNIDGRTTIPFMIGWGFGGMILIKLIYPLVTKIVNKIPYLIGNIIYYLLFIFLVIDITLTYTALGRMALRWQNIKPLTFIGEYYDKNFDDEYLFQKFPVMQKIKNN